ncbi:aliphatic sulfonate ABC transporter ATP-binding protein [Longimycelium tulufanense]|uniref:Aliphatic sulfonate ABC transporter ATP-binding protein n=1 Tax=Longimycelium tulufanense TaxID=907463 RepID=A0A8J3CCF7_9PSEU|nr:ABC transporter ATP-binding protein [Longimycelium tulufanense]GGM47138.1 aliphatic sulfonate ABC transporter ATP-binding protein [Longimycelium tulufanense]
MADHDRELTAARLRGVGKTFDGRRVLDGIDLTLGAGEFVALLGPSGSGKSTLLRLLAGLDNDFDGELTVPGRVSVAFQDPRLLPWRRVGENIALGLRRTDPREAARQALAEVRLDHHLNSWPSTLSGGEAQRVSLARALVREPDLLLLDEPFSALDALTRLVMHRLVSELWQRHSPAVLLVTHDVDEALLLADRVLVLGGGRIAAEYRISEPRPRRRVEFAELRQRILGDLGVNASDAA